MKILIATFFLILVATAAVAQPPAAWKSYTVKGEAFSVVFPTLPAMATNEEFIDRFGKFRRQRLLGAYAEGLVYTASCYLNPKQELLEDFIEQEIFTHSTFDRTSEKDLKRNGFSGKQYVAPDKIPGTVQFFLTGKTVYRFEVFGAGLDDPRVQQFFSSLVLGKSASGIEVTDGFGVPYESGPITQTDWSTQKPIVGRQADRKTAVIMKPEPMYTEEARKKGTTGTVVLKVVFFSDGSVGKINTIADLPYGLTEKAIEAARKIKFIPAVKDGKFVSMWMQLEYNFNFY
jgi:TonB family protein